LIIPYLLGGFGDKQWGPARPHFNACISFKNTHTLTPVTRHVKLLLRMYVLEKLLC